MRKKSVPKSHLKAVHIIEKIELLGFPNVNSISKIDELVKKLEALSFSFKDPGLVLSIKRIRRIIEIIKMKLENNERILVSTYMKFNDALIVFKEDSMFVR